MKRVFEVIRGGRWNDVEAVKEQKTARTRYKDQKAFLASMKKKIGTDLTFDSKVTENRLLSNVG